jgi:phosphoserine phosphatase
VIELVAEAAGVRAEVAAATEAAMRGELDFTTSLRRRLALLAGLPATALMGVRARIRVTTGARKLISGVHAAGGAVAAVSGGFTAVLDPLAAELGLDAWRANELELEDGRLTGRVVGPVVDGAVKRESLLAWATERGVPPSRTVAVGDGANDLAMMRAAALSVAFDAKPAVRAAASVVLPERDLSRLLPLLGLPRS